MLIDLNEREAIILFDIINQIAESQQDSVNQAKAAILNSAHPDSMEKRLEELEEGLSALTQMDMLIAKLEDVVNNFMINSPDEECEIHAEPEDGTEGADLATLTTPKPKGGYNGKN